MIEALARFVSGRSRCLSLSRSPGCFSTVVWSLFTLRGNAVSNGSKRHIFTASSAVGATICLSSSNIPVVARLVTLYTHHNTPTGRACTCTYKPSHHRLPRSTCATIPQSTKRADWKVWTLSILQHARRLYTHIALSRIVLHFGQALPETPRYTSPALKRHLWGTVRKESQTIHAAHEPPAIST